MDKAFVGQHLDYGDVIYGEAYNETFFFYNKTVTHKHKKIYNHQVYYKLLHLGQLKQRTKFKRIF